MVGLIELGTAIGARRRFAPSANEHQAAGYANGHHPDTP